MEKQHEDMSSRCDVVVRDRVCVRRVEEGVVNVVVVGQVIVVVDVSVVVGIVIVKGREVVVAESVVIVAIVMENASAKVGTVFTNVTKRCQCTRSCVAVDDEDVQSNRRCDR